jgi:O-antigen/teichoic acid export membrane protein
MTGTTGVADRPDATRRSFFGPGAVETGIFTLSLITGPVVSRALGDADRGQLAAVVVPVQLLGWAMLLGLPYGSAMLARTFPKRDLIDSAWRIPLAMTIPVALIGWFVAPALLGDDQTAAITWFRIGLVVVLLGLPTATATQLRMIDTGGTWRTSLAQGLALVGYSASIIVLALLGELTLAHALAAWFLTLAGGHVAVLTMYRGWPRGRGSTQVLRRQLGVGSPQWIITLSQITVGRADQVFLAAIGSSAALGHYAVAATAAQASLPVASGIANVVLPDAFHRGESDVQRSAMPVVLGASIAIAVATAALAPWLLPLVFGDDFEASVGLLWVLLPGQVMFNTGWVASARHLGAGRAGSAARALGGAAIIYVVLLGPAVAMFGPYGAAAMTTICQAAFFVGIVARPGSRTRAGSARSESA